MNKNQCDAIFKSKKIRANLLVFKWQNSLINVNSNGRNFYSLMAAIKFRNSWNDSSTNHVSLNFKKLVHF